MRKVHKKRDTEFAKMFVSEKYGQMVVMLCVDARDETKSWGPAVKLFFKPLDDSVFLAEVVIGIGTKSGDGSLANAKARETFEKFTLEQAEYIARNSRDKQAMKKVESDIGLPMSFYDTEEFNREEPE